MKFKKGVLNRHFFIFLRLGFALFYHKILTGRRSSVLVSDAIYSFNSSFNKVGWHEI